jgi:acetyl esterase/lipase
MPLQSDITISVSKFDPVNNSDQAIKVNEQLIKILDGGPKWYEVGASKYREMRWAGNTPLPPPRMLPQAMDIKIPSRESGRDIPCRLMYPTSRPTEELRKQCKGVVIHYHGGGWVLGDEKSTDSLLQHYANAGDMAVISVGYRHAPEDPFPKGPEDCVDAAEYLVENAESQYGGSLKFIGGEVRNCKVFYLLQITLKCKMFYLPGIHILVWLTL